MRGIQAVEVKRFLSGVALAGLAAVALMAARPAVAMPTPASDAFENSSDTFATELSLDTSVYTGGAFEAAVPSEVDSAESTAMIPVPEPSTVATMLLASLGGGIYWCRRRFDALSGAG